MADLIGKRLGQYEITALLGEGGMATVYRAKQVSIGRDVAIKVLSAKLTNEADFLRRFDREARTVAALNHPHILKIFDYGDAEGLVYLVMELHPGGSLASLIKRGPFSTERAALIIDQMASALDYAHELGIIHRDLKPQNVLLDGRGNAILTDFGIAKLMSADTTILTMPGMAIGTPAYMSPEQWQGRTLDARSDIYSLGVMLFEMLSGKLPFHADTPASLMFLHVMQSPPSIRDLRADLPPAIETVIARALAKDPTNRYQSAGELAGAFRATLAARGTQSVAQTIIPPKFDVTNPNAPPPAPPLVTETPTQRAAQQPTMRTPRKQSSLLPGVLAVGVVLIIALVGLIIALLSGGGPTPSTGGTPTGDATGTALAALPSDAPPSSTPTPPPTETPTALPTETPPPTTTPTITPDGSATALQSTANALTATAIAIASFTKTPTPTETPDFAATAAFIGTFVAQTQTAIAISSSTHTPTATEPPNMQLTIEAIVAATMTAAAPTPEVRLVVSPPRLDAARREYVLTISGVVGQEYLREILIELIDGIGLSVSQITLAASAFGDVRLPIPDGPAQIFTIRVYAIGFDGAVLYEASRRVSYLPTPRAVATRTPTRTRIPTRTPTVGVALLGPQPIATSEGGAASRRGANARLVHKDDGTIKTQRLGVQARDFVVEATFGNPYATSRGGWDIGFLFRNQGSNQQWRIVVTSNRDWLLYNAQGQAPPRADKQGKVNNLNTSANGSNTLRLAAFGDLGILWVNNQFVTTLDLSGRVNAGHIDAAVGMTAGREIEGEETPLSNFVGYFPKVARANLRGSLTHKADRRIEGYSTGVNSRNFVADAVFTNPYTSSVGQWDAGYLFRHEGENRQLRVIVVSNGRWFFGNADGSPPETWLEQGTVRNLNVGANATNRITLIAIANRGFLLVNGELVADFDLSVRTNAGNLFIATDFFTNNEYDGTVTRYSNFSLWTLD